MSKESRRARLRKKVGGESLNLVPPAVVASKGNTSPIKRYYSFDDWQASIEAEDRRIEQFKRELEAARKSPSFWATGRYADSLLGLDVDTACVRFRKYCERTREVNSSARLSIHGFPLGLNGELRKRYVPGHCQQCDRYKQTYGEIPDSYVPAGCTSGLKVVRTRTCSLNLYPGGVTVSTTSLRGLFPREFWAALRDPHVELVSVHGTLPTWFASGRTLKLLRRIKNRRMRLPWGCLVFGDRSDPKNVELELSPLLIRRVQGAKPAGKRRLLRDLLGKVRAYAETIISRLFGELVTRNARASSSVQAQNTLSGGMGGLPVNVGVKGPSSPDFF